MLAHRMRFDLVIQLPLIVLTKISLVIACPEQGSQPKEVGLATSDKKDHCHDYIT